MTTKPKIDTRAGTHKQITLWVPNPQISALDTYLAREASRLPGARLSRAAWLAALIARELAAAQPAPGQDPTPTPTPNT